MHEIAVIVRQLNARAVASRACAREFAKRSEISSQILNRVIYRMLFIDGIWIERECTCLYKMTKTSLICSASSVLTDYNTRLVLEFPLGKASLLDHDRVSEPCHSLCSPGDITRTRLLLRLLLLPSAYSSEEHCLVRIAEVSCMVYRTVYTLVVGLWSFKSPVKLWQPVR